MTDETSSVIVAVAERVFGVTAYRSTSRSMLLTVTVDGSDQWTFDVAGWRPWSCGVGQGVFYVWTARKLIVFTSALSAPVEVDVDEDLLYVFRLESGWVLVCETSVRLTDNRHELDRIEFDDVVEAAYWRHRSLVVRQLSSSTETAINVGADTLQIDPSGL
jgi:hypothetical protein